MNHSSLLGMRRPDIAAGRRSRRHLAFLVLACTALQTAATAATTVNRPTGLTRLAPHQGASTGRCL